MLKQIVDPSKIELVKWTYDSFGNPW